jgi:hypothetical protein
MTSSTDFLQAHSPLSYFPWTNTELINEPAYLDDFCPQLDEPFDFSLDPKGHERQRVDSVTESLSLTTSTATNLECESVYCPPEFSYGYQDLLISGQPFPDSYTRQVESGLRTFPTCSWDTDCNPEDVSQQLMCSACSKTFSNLRALDKHTQSTSHKAAGRVTQGGIPFCGIGLNIATTVMHALTAREMGKRSRSRGKTI